MNADGTDQQRFTYNPALDNQPAWSADGNTIAFVSDRDGHQEIYLRRLDQAFPTRLIYSEEEKRKPEWSPDSAWLVYVSGSAIWRIRPDGTEATQISEGLIDYSPAVSPDGRKIAFTSLRDGDEETYVMEISPTSPAQFAVPTGVTRAPSGEIYVADSQNGRVRKLDAHRGNITTAAGGGREPFPTGDYSKRVATNVLLGSIRDVAALPDGDVLVVVFNRVFRLEVRTGLLSVFAGTGERGYRGDWGPATEAQLNSPMSVAVGKDGAVYISDWGNDRVRMVRPDGVIVTVAGNGTKGFSGDGGPAVEAALNGPVGLAADAAGQL